MVSSYANFLEHIKKFCSWVKSSIPTGPHRIFFVHQYGRRDVMQNPSLYAAFKLYYKKNQLDV